MGLGGAANRAGEASWSVNSGKHGPITCEEERDRYLPGGHPGVWTPPVPLLKVGREDPLMSRLTHVPREAQDWRGGVPRTPVLVNTLPAV